ncbi:hypothetical protein VNG_0772H [Halobacterium salinarum NRC-1]|uniref:Spurious ORF n=1 Tax=Halobacterium salinarum (strain ATCC 700922 / JCM 11081 / NRC-1) TaxID=64091 RepID=Q9HRB4_HALSA|nr:hypothetical protein VNG_0772H [Halobacterium salinarum NRC-1]DAC77949.1 TPA_inf: spurious ORF [Halobacterium salinarum NRC-1]
MWPVSAAVSKSWSGRSWTNPRKSWARKSASIVVETSAAASSTVYDSRAIRTTVWASMSGSRAASAHARSYARASAMASVSTLVASMK